MYVCVYVPRERLHILVLRAPLTVAITPVPVAGGLFALTWNLRMYYYVHDGEAVGGAAPPGQL